MGSIAADKTAPKVTGWRELDRRVAGAALGIFSAIVQAEGMMGKHRAGRGMATLYGVGATSAAVVGLTLMLQACAQPPRSPSE